jgi:hypothetical protein
MSEENARAFAAQAIQDAPTRLQLYRYLEAYQFAKDSVAQGGLGLPASTAERIAQAQEYLPSQSLYLFKVVYHEALADSWTDMQGVSHRLDPYRARMIAENILHNPGSDYARYHFAFSALPMQNPSDFINTLSSAVTLSQASVPTYEKFRSTYDNNLHRMSPPQAFNNAQAEVPMTLSSQYLATDYAPVSTPMPALIAQPADATSPGATYVTQCKINSPLSGSGVAPNMGDTLAATEISSYTPDPHLNFKIQEDIYSAATAFGVPEKFLACTMKIESNGHPTACSYRRDGEALAAGIMQITAPTYATIARLSQTSSGTNAYLGQGWLAYKNLQNDPRNPVREPASDWPQACYDPSWSVGASALLYRDYASQLFGAGTDPRTLNIDQLSMLAASYNAGPNGLKRNCHNMNDVKNCLSALSNTNTETYNYIIKMSSCLKGPGPEVI